MAVTLSVELLGSKRKIWRSFVVKNDIMLSDLHDILQIILGWRDAHLHEFIVHKLHFGDVAFNEETDPKLYSIDERTAPLSQIIHSVKTSFLYNYDNDWHHKIRIVSILPLEKNLFYPSCISGQNACPPEDLVGIEEYDKLIADLAKKGRKYEERREWLVQGGYKNFDPKSFNIDAVNKVLSKRFKS